MALSSDLAVGGPDPAAAIAARKLPVLFLGARNL